MDYKKLYEQTLVENKELKEHYNKTMSVEHGWGNAIMAKMYETKDIENEALHEQLEQYNEWFQEINSICGVDPQEPAVESVRDTIQELKDNQLTEESAIDYVYQHTSDYEDWIMGSDIYLKLSKKSNAKSDIIRNLMDKILKDVNLDDGFSIGREWGHKYIDEWNKIVTEEFNEVIKDINRDNYEYEDFRLTTDGYHFDFETIEEE